jgi:radical SAM superfamily enzyme YgiQ (UPF0313 family)
VKVVLISTYELGRQPFGLASPAAWLGQVGATVTCLDLAVQPLDDDAVATADLIALYVPMHTATRLAAELVPRIRAVNPLAHLCFYGLYASVNGAFLRRLGAQTILSGEFEAGLVALVQQLQSARPPATIARDVSLARQKFLVPDRSGLPPLGEYAHMQLARAGRRVVGATEASRGCKHQCRHCPIPPVYGGHFRVVQPDVVLADIAQQVAAGARHITFGDPDFFNGPRHAMDLVAQFHERWPDLTYDVTIKIEHLLRHADLLPGLVASGCLFVTTAVEAVDDRILEIFDKRHTRADFVQAVDVCRGVGLTLNPTFVTFTPWTTLRGYLDLLHLLFELDLVEHVASIQYAIRLLIPSGSLLLELPMVRALVQPFAEAALCYPWSHPDPRVDRLYGDVLAAVKAGQQAGEARGEIFSRVWRVAHAAVAADVSWSSSSSPPRRALNASWVPRLSEPWFC